MYNNSTFAAKIFVATWIHFTTSVNPSIKLAIKGQKCTHGSYCSYVSSVPTAQWMLFIEVIIEFYGPITRAVKLFKRRWIKAIQTHSLRGAEIYRNGCKDVFP